MIRWPPIVPACLAGLCVPGVAGCASPHPSTIQAPPGGLIVTAHAGGTHYGTLVVGGFWYQSWGGTLLVIDPPTGDVRRSIELAPVGAAGPATAMALVGDELFVALDGSEVVALSVADPLDPRIEHRVGHARLGVEPATLSVVGDELYVSGAGGVVRWSDRARWLPDMDCGTVVASGVGLVACSGRRVHRLDDAGFVGSASVLYPLPDGTGPGGGFIFVRAGSAASVGLMTGGIREVNMRLATVRVESTVRCVRIFDDRLWIVSDSRIAAYPISGDSLLEPVVYPIAGARDLDFVEGRRAVVVGAFGRALVRFDRDGGVHTLRDHREPAGLVAARSDGRLVQAGGQYGWWEYEPSGRVRALATAPGGVAAPPLSAETLAGRVSIADDGASVILPGGAAHVEPGSAAIACVVAVDGDLWIGHDRGITVLDAGGAVIARLRLAGPVRYVFPLASGGAAWVSETGGFGTVVLAADR